MENLQARLAYGAGLKWHLLSEPGWAEWNEAQHTNLAITTSLITRSPAPIRHYPFSLYTAAQLYAECVQPNLAPTQLQIPVQSAPMRRNALRLLRPTQTEPVR